MRRDSGPTAFRLAPAVPAPRPYPAPPCAAAVQVGLPLDVFLQQYGEHLGGERLVGRRLCVLFWDSEDDDGAYAPEWVPAQVVGFEPKSGKHKVRLRGAAGM